MQLGVQLLCLFHNREHCWIQRDGGNISKIPVKYKNGKHEATEQCVATLVADNRFLNGLLVRVLDAAIEKLLGLSHGNRAQRADD